MWIGQQHTRNAHPMISCPCRLSNQIPSISCQNPCRPPPPPPVTLTAQKLIVLLWFSDTRVCIVISTEHMHPYHCFRGNVISTASPLRRLRPAVATSLVPAHPQHTGSSSRPPLASVSPALPAARPPTVPRPRAFAPFPRTAR